MPDKRKHRGPHPQDAEAFHPHTLPTLLQASADLAWLLTRGYASTSSLKIVGDRYRLSERQRTALLRCACSDQSLSRRLQGLLGAHEVRGRVLLVDGYNALTTVEAALSGAVILHARDGCCRDLASMHGTFHRVEETLPALDLLGNHLNSLGLAACHWYLDSPVSNSGRLAALLRSVVQQRNWNWEVALVNDPDAVLARSNDVAASADSNIIERCQHWYNLAREVIDRHVPQAWIVDLGRVG